MNLKKNSFKYNVSQFYLNTQLSTLVVDSSYLQCIFRFDIHLVLMEIINLQPVKWLKFFWRRNSILCVFCYHFLFKFPWIWATFNMNWTCSKLTYFTMPFTPASTGRFGSLKHIYWYLRLIYEYFDYDLSLHLLMTRFLTVGRCLRNTLLIHSFIRKLDNFSFSRMYRPGISNYIVILVLHT